MDIIEWILTWVIVPMIGGFIGAIIAGVIKINLISDYDTRRNKSMASDFSSSI